MSIKNRIRHPLRVLLAALLVLALLLPAAADVQYPQKNADYITDDAAVLSESTVKQLLETNATLKKETHALIGVCTVKTTNGIDIAKYARSVFTEWGFPAGILIVAAADDNNFYFLQSLNVSETITNEDLEHIRDTYLEDDFRAGEVDRAIRKAVSQLSILMLSRMKITEEEGAETTADMAKTGTSAGSVIVKVLKTILILVLVAVGLFLVLFVIAMFNDDVAAFMQKYIFRSGRRNPVGEPYYDERLYGNRQSSYSASGNRQYPNNGQRQYPNNGQRQYPNNGQRQYPNNGQRPYPNYQNGAQQNRQRPVNPNQAPVYYNADGTVRQQTVRQPRPNPNYAQNSGQNPNRNAAYQQQNPGYGQQQNGAYSQQNNGTRQAQNSPEEDGATRYYTIPGRQNPNNR